MLLRLYLYIKHERITPMLSDGGQDASRLEQERDAAVRCSARLCRLLVTLVRPLTRWNVTQKLTSSLSQPAAHCILVSTIVLAESRFKITLLHWHTDIIQPRPRKHNHDKNREASVKEHPSRQNHQEREVAWIAT